MGDIPSHEFHGNQYSGAGESRSCPTSHGLQVTAKAVRGTQQLMRRTSNMIRRALTFVLLSAGVALGQGSITQTQYPVVHNTYRYDVAWVADGLGDVSVALDIVPGIVRQVEFIPDGTLVPDDNYDVTLLDGSSVDVLAGKGLNQSDTVAAIAYLADAYFYDGTYRPVLTVAAAGADNSGTVRVWLDPAVATSFPQAEDIRLASEGVAVTLGDVSAGVVSLTANSGALDVVATSVNASGDAAITGDLSVGGNLTVTGSIGDVTEVLVVVTPQAATCTAGVGTSALSLTPTSSYIEITNSDADGCDITLNETGAVAGEQVEITLISTAGGTVTIKETAGVTNLVGTGDFAITLNDTIGLRYATTLAIFNEQYRSVN